MPQLYQPMTHLAYQTQAPLHGTDDFERSMKDAIRQIRRSAVDLTQGERNLLDDIGRGRYLKGLRKVAEIARTKCIVAADATALAECVRGFILQGHVAVVSPFDALRQETQANHWGNAAEFEWVVSPTRASKEQVVEALRAQEIASRGVIDSLHRAA